MLTRDNIFGKLQEIRIAWIEAIRTLILALHFSRMTFGRNALALRRRLR
jgi:hypothetical protein